MHGGRQRIARHNRGRRENKLLGRKAIPLRCHRFEGKMQRCVDKDLPNDEVSFKRKRVHQRQESRSSWVLQGREITTRRERWRCDNRRHFRRRGRRPIPPNLRNRSLTDCPWRQGAKKYLTVIPHLPAKQDPMGHKMLEHLHWVHHIIFGEENY